MRVRINELLTIARLPASLWTPIHGGREHYDNPGSSVLSLCARYLSSELIEVPPDVQESVQQCRDFSTKREYVDVYLNFLYVKAEVLGQKVNQLDVQAQRSLYTEFTEAVRLNQEVKRIVEVFEVNGVMPARLDASSQVFPMFLQTVLDFYWTLDQLESKIIQLSSGAA